MANSDIPIKIEFQADAGNVKETTQQLKRDLSELGKGGAQGLGLQSEIQRAQVDLRKLVSSPLDLKFKLPTETLERELKSVRLDLPINTEKLNVEAARALGELSRLAKGLPPIEIPLKLPKANNADLDGIKSQLDGVLQLPGLQRGQAFSGILQQLDAWKAANGQLLLSNNALKSQYESLTASATAGLREVATNTSSLAGIAAEVAKGFAGAATVLGGIAAASLAVASNFESLQAKLESVTGSSAKALDKFNFAKELAAKTPFDVQGVVSAAATLEGYRQKAESMLPVAANLAAAMGKTLPEAALVLGKAASGSAEGFETLRNEYAITTDDLLKFGAVEGKVSGTLSHATQDIEANRNALVKIINLRYGDAIERQSKTLTGAMSNLGDAGKNAASDFAQGLIPAATLSAKVLSSLINIADAVPGPLKLIAAAGTVALAGVLGLGGVALGAVVALVSLQANLARTVFQLREMGIQAPLASAGLKTLTSAVNNVSGAMTAGNLANVAFGVGILSVASIAATAGLALADSWEKAAVQMGDRIRDASRESVEATKLFRSSINILNQAGKQAGVTVGIIGNAGDHMEQIVHALASIPKDQIADALVAAGVTAEKLDEQLKNVEESATKSREKLVALIDIRRLLNEDASPLSLGTHQGTEERLHQAQDLGLKSGITFKDGDDLELQIKGEENKAKKTAATRVALLGEKDALKDTLDPLNEVTRVSKQLSQYLDLSKQVGTTDALTNALKQVNAQIEDNAAKAKIGTDNLEQLLVKLANPKLKDYERDALTAQVGLVQQRNSLLDQQKTAAEQAAKAATDAEELGFRRRKALGEANLHDELYFVQQRLKGVQQGSEEEVALLERAKQLKDGISNDQLKRAQDSLKKQIEAGKQAVQDAQAGVSNQSVLGAIESAKDGVERWAKANEKPLKQFGELRQLLAEFGADNALQQKKAESDVLKTSLTKMVDGLRISIADATGAEQKLAAVTGAINTLQQARAAGMVDAKGTQKEITRLTVEQLGIERQVTQEKRQQAISLANQQLQNKEAELQILQARKASGAQVETEITENRKQQHEQRLALIEKEKQAAIAAGLSKVAAEQQAQGKITAEESRVTLQRIQDEHEKQQKASQRAQSLESLDLQELESSAQVLEARKSAGEDVENQITANRRAQLQERIQLIELEKQAALGSGQDRVVAEATAQSKLRQLQDQEKVRLLQHVNEMNAIKSRVGNEASPLFSDPNDGFRLQFDAFGLGNFNPSQQFHQQLQEKLHTDFIPPDTRRAELTRQINDNERQQRQLSKDPNLNIGGGAGGGLGAGGSIQNVTNNFNGIPFDDIEFERHVLGILAKGQASASLRRSK